MSSFHVQQGVLYNSVSISFYILAPHREERPTDWGLYEEDVESIWTWENRRTWAGLYDHREQLTVCIHYEVGY